MTRRDDGTLVFAFPTDKGRVLMISLAYFVRYSFDSRATISGKDLEIAGDVASLDKTAEIFKKFTGKKAVAIHLTVEEWFGPWKNPNIPMASERPIGDGSTTWRQDMTAFWCVWRDEVIKRAIEWIRKVNPNGDIIEKWKRDNNFTGELDLTLLKSGEDGKGTVPDWDTIAATLGQAYELSSLTLYYRLTVSPTDHRGTIEDHKPVVLEFHNLYPCLSYIGYTTYYTGK